MNRRRGAGKPPEFAAGAVDRLRGRPVGIVEAGLVPTVLDEARVKIFAAKDRGKGDGAGSGAPIFVRADEFDRAISVFEADLRDGLERAERAFELG